MQNSTVTNTAADSMEQRARNEIDRCDSEIERKERLIAEKQKFIEVLEREMTELKKQRGSLEFIISGTRPAIITFADENQERMPFIRQPSRYHNNTTRSLTGSVAEILQDDANGLTVAEISDRLKEKGFNTTTSNFYQVVYSTCVRLARSPNSNIARKEDAKRGIVFIAEKNPA